MRVDKVSLVSWYDRAVEQPDLDLGPEKEST
jgi:hypothetical protein